MNRRFQPRARSLLSPPYLAASLRYPFTTFRPPPRAALGTSPPLIRRDEQQLSGELQEFASPRQTSADLHGCDSGGRDASAGHPSEEQTTDAEPEKGESEAEEAKGVGFHPDLLVRRLAAARQGAFLLRGEFR